MATQKRIETFFTVTQAKRAKTTDEGIASSLTSADATAASASAEPSLPAPQTESAVDAKAVAPAETKARQREAMQALRAHANRNGALAKQAVVQAERAGTVPALTDLLVEPSWKELLGDEFKKPYFKDLERYLQTEWNAHMVFPPKDSIFRAMNSCPVDKVRVVILGQDPYHNIGQAQGLSFSVPQGKQIPSSLRNMYKELKEDLACPIARHGCLEKWAHQGVLLLNAVLTVRAHNAASHAKKGWEKFTDEAVARLSRQHPGLVFLLWGRYAQEKGKVIDKSKRHHVLTAAHPSGLSAARGFFGCRHFSKCNDLLRAEGALPIDWCIEENY
jgi:uracil-DNA glycosylase